MPQPPAFIAFTGVDRVDVLGGLKALSRRFPIEWGVLVDDEKIGEALFPDSSARRALLRSDGLRWAAHVCGGDASKIANAPETVGLDLIGFQRVQVNHSFSGSTLAQMRNAWRFGRLRGVRTMLQCIEDFPNETRVDWLFDTSFGAGVAPKAWPRLPKDGPFCGFSGGINPDNVADVVAAIGAAEGDLYWIDMESGIRTDGWLDLQKCEAVCRKVYG